MITNPKFKLVLRIIFGLFCLIFGLNKFLHFIPIPPVAGDGGVLLGIYASSGFFKIIGGLEILGGLALLIEKYVPFFLIVLVAIMFNATIFHLLHDIGGLAGALVGLILGLVLVSVYKTRFLSIMSP